MINIKRSYRDLDNLLTGLEQDILDLDDRELNTETELLFGRVQVVRDVIEDGLQSRVSVDQPFSDRRATQSPHGWKQFPMAPRHCPYQAASAKNENCWRSSLPTVRVFQDN